MGAPLFPKMKKLPPDIQVARDMIERKPDACRAKSQKNQTESISSCSVQSGVIKAVQTGDIQTITVNIAWNTP